MAIAKIKKESRKKRFIEVAPSVRSIKELCDEVGITRTTFIRYYQEDTDFREEIIKIIWNDWGKNLNLSHTFSKLKSGVMSEGDFEKWVQYNKDYQREYQKKYREKRKLNEIKIIENGGRRV